MRSATSSSRTVTRESSRLVPNTPASGPRAQATTAGTSTATTMPGGGGELRLMQRGSEFSIMSGTTELMNSRLSGSEAARATLACDRLGARPAPRMLIGGLGMGFTLQAAQAVLPGDAEIVVAELVPAVVAWARGPLAGVFCASLDDSRLTLRELDVADLIK